MLFIIRFIFVIVYCVLVCVIGFFYCLFSFRNPRHVATFSHIFGYLAPIFGLKVETRKHEKLKNFVNAIYIANHQNNYDMVTVSNIVEPFTVTVGKKSLVWIPFFGQLYWATGNLLIDRNHRTKSYNTISKIINYIKNNHRSIWIFPEGTRNYGKGLLPFKTGAFYIAIMTGIPIIPVCVSNTSKKVHLNRLNNGLVIVEMLSPIDVSNYSKNKVHELAKYCHQLMSDKIDMLNKEVAKREESEKM